MLKKNWSRSLLLLLAVLLVLSSFGVAAFANPSGNHDTALEIGQLFGEHDLTSASPTTVIVELTEQSIVEAKHNGKKQSSSKLATERNKVKNELFNKVKGAQVHREYEYVFSGFAVELPANAIPQLLTIPGVKAVYPNVEYTVDTLGGGEVVEDDAYSPEMLASAPFIGAHQAWAAGYTGRGVTVAVIDTGVDYTHPDLAHAFGDYKGWDFVDNDADPQETPVGDPRGGSTDHGTHVAGTVAANGLIKGVAPEATLLAYRVLGPGGSGTTANVVAGIEKAVQDGAQVMNLSLGNSLNNPDWATSIALDWAMAEGVVAVTSNGNSGPNNWTVGSPGTSRQAISVGATQLPYNVYTSSIFTSEGVTYPSAKVMGFPSDGELLALNEGEYEFVYVGLGAPQDFVGKDLTGKIALISRGGFPFVDKATNAKNAGAVGAIIFNNVAGEHPDVPGMAVPTIKTTLADGQKLLAELDAGNNTVSFDIQFASQVGETVASFSSRGPVTLTWMIKPDVSAPGVNITSTIPTHNPANPHGYGAKQGTSMASPHVAGAAALLLQKHPHWGTQDVKAALMNTAENMVDPVTNKQYPHNTQGAGSIRIVDALKTTTLVSPGSHSFGVFSKDLEDKQVDRQGFTIKNLSNERKRYSVNVQFAGNPDGIKISHTKNLTVQANSQQTVNFKVQVTTSKLQPGYYEGTIQVNDGAQIVEMPTILFVGEPDYPRVTSAYLSKLGEGSYEFGSFLPGGAEVVEYYLYHYTNGGVGAPIAFLKADANVPVGYHSFAWDGKINGTNLANGQYVLAVYAEKAGKSDFRAFLVTKN